METGNREKTYTATSLQQGMIYNSLAHPSSGVEIEQIVFTIDEILDIKALRKAWAEVIKRHDILRTSFQWSGTKEILQIVSTHVHCQQSYHDWTGIMPNEKKDSFKEYLGKDRLTDFDLTKAPLMRVAVLKMSDAAFKVVWTFHHAILDGRAFPIVIEELFNYYEAHLQGKQHSTSEPRQFEEYVRWLESQSLEKDEAYWKAALKNFIKPNQIPILTSEHKGDYGSDYGYAEKKLSESLSNALRLFSKANDLSLNAIIQGAWAKILYHYTGDEDIVFGTTWSCRYADLEGARDIVGLLINTVPMRVEITDDKNVLQFLKEIRERNIAMRKHLFAPLSEIRRWSPIKPGGQMFESLVVFENYLLDSLLRKKGGAWEKRRFEYIGQTNYPITLACYNDKEILIRIEYYKNRFEESAVVRILNHLETVLINFEKNAHFLVMEAPYLTEYEERQLLIEWNDTESKYPKDSSIDELFEEQVKLRPNETAVSFEGKILSYSELNNKSNQLAKYLVSLGIKPETKVGFCIDRSLELVVVIIGILKAGGAYVPLDPEYPQERLDYMIDDTEATILIVQKKWAERIQTKKAKKIYVEDIITHESHKEENVRSGVKAGNLAYIMYTSGSTGRPKGIEVTHRNVVRLVKNTNFAEFGNKEVFLLYAPVSFDASTLEIWGALLNGGKIVICPPGQLSPQELGKIIKTNKVTFVWITAGLFHNIVEYDIECLSSVKQLLSGGDVLSPSAVRKVVSEINDVCMINGYGPTENTTFTCCYPMRRGVHIGKTVPIGSPISNTKVYVLDKSRQPVPVGVPGELYTSGDGVARGYLNQPELTKEVFISNPFSKSKDSMMYKTGDLVRYMPDGNIEFLGRIDKQVKLRGYRIELGEIESILSMHHAVSQVVTVAREDKPGSKVLVAYFIPKSHTVGNIENELREYLGKKLPQYMIPQFFIKLDRFPLTSNGKIDRDILPLPNNLSKDSSEFKEPSNEIEKQILKIWKKVIGVERISVDDNFSDIGGDSLMAVIVFSELYYLTGKDLPLSTFLRAPTIRKLALEFANKKDNEKDEISLYIKDDSENNRTDETQEHDKGKNIWSSLVEIKGGSAGRSPFFCIHAAGGNVLNYKTIAAHLDDEQPIYGIQSRGLDGRTRPAQRLEEMASHYIKEIRSVQPRGPYLLGGGSMGGMIAFEVAHQLKRAGEKVGLLVMFDTLGPNYEDYTLSGEVKKMQDRIKSLWMGLTERSLSGCLAFLFEKTTFRVSLVLRKAMCSLCYLLRIPVPHDKRYWYIEQMNIEALNNYNPKKYDGDVDIVVGSVEEDGLFSDPARGWEGVVTGSLRLHRIEGRHEELVEKEALAKILNRLLRERNGKVTL